MPRRDEYSGSGSRRDMDRGDRGYSRRGRGGGGGGRDRLELSNVFEAENTGDIIACDTSPVSGDVELAGFD